MIKYPQIRRGTRLPIHRSTSKAAFSSNARCCAEPVDLETHHRPAPDAAVANQLKSINSLIAYGSWEAVVRLVDQQVKATHTPEPVFQRAMFESARGFALDKLGRQEAAIKSYRSALNGFLSSRESAASGAPLTMECFASLSGLLISAGSYSEAVAVRQKAVEFIRPLVDEHPDLTPHLVRSLWRLGIALMQAEDSTGALSALQDAYTLLQRVQRRTAQIDQLAADILRAMVAAYQTLKRWSDALPLSEQLVKKGKAAIGAARPSGAPEDSLEATYVHDLCSHADTLWSMGRAAECLAAHEQSLAIVRRLYDRAPAEHALELAALLHNYSLRQAPQAQFVLMTEGLGLLRGQSAKADRLRITYLMNMSKLLRESGLDGTKDAREAVEIADRLAAGEPVVFWRARVDAREALSRALEAAHRPRERLVVLKETIRIRRAHVPRSGATAKDVAELINDLEKTSQLAAQLSDPDAAVDFGTQAFTLSSQYLANDVEYRNQHSEVLCNLCVQLNAGKKHQLALRHAQAAVELARAWLLDGNADAYPSNVYALITALLSLRDAFAGLDDPPARLSVAKDLFAALKQGHATDFGQAHGAAPRFAHYFHGELVFDIGRELWTAEDTGAAARAAGLDALRFCAGYLPTVRGQEAASLLALNDLGGAVRRRGEPEGWIIPTMVAYARKWFGSGAIGVPDFSQTLLNLAADQYQRGSFEEALDTLEEALLLLAGYVEPVLEARRTDPNTETPFEHAIAYYLHALEMKQALLVLSAKGQGDSPQRALETALEILDKIESTLALFPPSKFYRSRICSGLYWRIKVLVELGDAVGAHKALVENSANDFEADLISSLDMYIAIYRCVRLSVQLSLQHLREHMSDQEVQDGITALEGAGREVDEFLGMENRDYWGTLLRGEHDFWPHDRSMLP